MRSHHAPPRNRIITALLLVSLAGVTACGCRAPWQAQDGSALPSATDASAESSSHINDTAPTTSGTVPESDPYGKFTARSAPDYDNFPSAEINNNMPFFTEEDLSDALALCVEDRDEALLSFSELDQLGRAGTAVAILSKADMATAERVPIPGIKPSGWHNAKYDWIDGNYVYNRCHLLGYQLTAENGDIRNLITGTRYLNIEGMLPYENCAASFLRRNPDSHILYRVTPLYSENDLVASGVLMEAVSLEDAGDGLCFCVYCYNVQPGVLIDYDTGMTQASQ